MKLFRCGIFQDKGKVVPVQAMKVTLCLSKPWRHIRGVEVHFHSFQNLGTKLTLIEHETYGDLFI